MTHATLLSRPAVSLPRPTPCPIRPHILHRIPIRRHATPESTEGVSNPSSSPSSESSSSSDPSSSPGGVIAGGAAALAVAAFLATQSAAGPSLASLQADSMPLEDALGNGTFAGGRGGVGGRL